MTNLLTEFTKVRGNSGGAGNNACEPQSDSDEPFCGVQGIRNELGIGLNKYTAR